VREPGGSLLDLEDFGSQITATPLILVQPPQPPGAGRSPRPAKADIRVPEREAGFDPGCVTQPRPGAVVGGPIALRCEISYSIPRRRSRGAFPVHQVERFDSREVE
jgi:hypothetical protein